MPEQPAWKFETLIRPLFHFEQEHWVLKGRVLTCKDSEVFENGFVEFDGGKIKAVGKASDLGSTDAKVVETKGTILPGIINSHAHMGWDGIHDLAKQSIYDSPEILAYKYCGNMLMAVRSGVTTVRDLGVHQSNLVTKQAVAQGTFPGPRLVVTGAPIVQTGGHTFWVCREASGPDEMRRAVREQVRGGADLIKIMACHDLLEFTDEEMAAVIDEAHRNGLPVTAHATFESCIRRVAEFGVDCIEHGGAMSAEVIQMLVDKGIFIVSTLAPVLMQADAENARKYNIPEWKIKERQKAVADPNRYAGLVNAAKAGVPIAFGTDAGSPAVDISVIAPELKFMVKLGIAKDTYDAIRAATIMGAKVCRIDSKVGTLEAGKLADVIVVDGNPLQDLDAIGNVKWTFLEGKLMYTAP